MAFVADLFSSQRHQSNNIGYGEAGVLFKTFGGGVVTEEPPLGPKGFTSLPLGTRCIRLQRKTTRSSLKAKCRYCPPTVWKYHWTCIGTCTNPSNFRELGLLAQNQRRELCEHCYHPSDSGRGSEVSVVGRYTPEQLYSTKRDAIQNEIYEETQKVVENQHVQLNAVLVRDVTLAPGHHEKESSES